MHDATRHDNDGLRKRCECTRAKWTKCPHPWHINYQFNRQHYRFSLHKYAQRRRDETMGKTEAERLLNDVIAAIHKGELTTTGRPIQQDTPVPADHTVTVSLAFDRYIADHVHVPARGAKGRKAIERLLDLTRNVVVPDQAGEPTAFQSKPLADVTQRDINAIRAARRAATAAILKARARVEQLRAKGEPVPPALEAKASEVPNLKSGEVAVDRLLARLRHFMNWCIGQGLIATTPFRRGTVVTIALAHAGEKRHRRLAAGEEEALMTGANAWLGRLIVAALETCCRLGELLAVQWRDVDLTRGELTVRAAEEGARKTGRGRILPISERLRKTLETMTHGPDGKRHGKNAYVFGDEVGGRIKSISTAWENCLLRAYGNPVRRDRKTRALLPESRAAVSTIDLHFHDLRHEAGSRLLEGGWPIHHVSHMLGHTTIEQTSTYLNATTHGLKESMRRLDSSGSFKPST